MLEVKKDLAEFDVFAIKNENGKYVRKSKPFENDGVSRKYITLHMRMLSTRSSNGKKKVGGQLGTIVKNVWEDRHRVLFEDITSEIKAGNIDEATGELTDLAISGNAYIADTKPYRTDINGQERIASRVRFFVLEGESPTQMYESATNGLKFVQSDDDFTPPEDKETYKPDDKPAGNSDDDI